MKGMFKTEQLLTPNLARHTLCQRPYHLHGSHHICGDAQLCILWQGSLDTPQSIIVAVWGTLSPSTRILDNTRRTAGKYKGPQALQIVFIIRLCCETVESVCCWRGHSQNTRHRMLCLALDEILFEIVHNGVRAQAQRPPSIPGLRNRCAARLSSFDGVPPHVWPNQWLFVRQNVYLGVMERLQPPSLVRESWPGLEASPTRQPWNPHLWSMTLETRPTWAFTSSPCGPRKMAGLW